MSDKIDLIYDLVKSDREESAEFRKEVRDTNKQVDERLVLIEAGLAEHMRRTDLLEDLHKDNASRIQKLEEPVKALSTFKKVMVWFGAVAGAIVAIAKLIGLL